MLYIAIYSYCFHWIPACAGMTAAEAVRVIARAAVSREKQ